MTRDEAFEFLDRTARGIAEMFGSSCETLVHDMGVPSHPILSIYNGHVSGREVGSTMDILGIGLELDADSSVTDFVNLAATTPDGRQTKSSTFHMIGEDYNLALGINFDYTSLVFANRILVDLMSASSDLQSALWQEGDSKQLADLFERCLAALGKPVDALNKKDRLRMIAMVHGVQVPGRAGRAQRGGIASLVQREVAARRADGGIAPLSSPFFPCFFRLGGLQCGIVVHSFT